MNHTILVTGATGFVGGSLVLELLKATEAQIVCLVRPRGPQRARGRLRDALEQACSVYGEERLIDDVTERCAVLEGDVTRPGCGVTRAARRRIDEVWHTAALVDFEDASQDDVRRVNVDGTRNVLELAGDLGATSCNHISTAYVGGAREGVVHEVLPPMRAPCNNAYERSALAAEHIAAEAAIDRVRIFRPSIVVGHSRTRAANTATGVYGFLNSLRRLQSQTGSTRRPPRLIGDPDVPIDCIPVDEVARAAVEISRSASPELVFHLTSSAPRRLADSLAVVAERVGMRAPSLVASADELTDLDEALNEQLVSYRPYLTKPKRFDRTHADAALGPNSGRYPLDDDAVAAYVDWYLQRPEAHRRGSMATVEVA